MTFFANNRHGVELAEEIIRAVPCAQQVRYVASGGEADMYAIRAARAFTGRSKLLKFEGGYHGMSAEAQMSLAPTVASNFPQAVPDSAGIPDAVRDEMLIAPFNDIEYVEGLLSEYAGQVAAVIVEPLQRIVPPEPGFLAALRECCTKHGVLLIFDEIVTGFRLAYGGAQAAYDVVPDICTLGKIVGGGFPLAAIAGRQDIMDHFDKAKVGAEGWLMQLGTLSGNPVAAVAGLKTMEVLARDGAYDTLHAHGARVKQIFTDALNAHGIAHKIVGHESLFEVLFCDYTVRNYRDTQAANGRLAAVWNDTLRQQGVFKSPGKTYPHLALTDADFDLTTTAAHHAALAVAECHNG